MRSSRSCKLLAALAWVFLVAVGSHVPLAHAARPVVLSHDDGKQDDKRSLGGDGHAVRFERPSEKYAVTAIRLFGSRYGGQYDPFLEVAKVSICDPSLKPIASAVLALEEFTVGTPKWVEVQLQPVFPPESFFVHVDFFATRTKGVYLGIDTDSSGHSITGTLGKPGSAFTQGDWMIRVVGTTRLKRVLTLDPSSKKELSYDDGQPDSKRSMAGAGHAIQFTAPRGESYLGAVSIHGSLYGGNYDPGRTLFNVFVCDSRMRPLSRSAHPYALFTRGEERWVTVDVPPVRLKGKFFVLVSFNPTQTRGIFVSVDNVKKPHSMSAMPNRPMGALAGQEWMIRATCMKRGKGTALAPPKTAKTKEGADAMQLARWRSSLDRLEGEEDIAGIKRLLANARSSSKSDAELLGTVHVTEHVFVRYLNVPEEYARAVATLYEACDVALKKRFAVESGICTLRGKRLHVHLLAEEGRDLRLWTSPGSAKFPLIVNTMPSWKRGLSPPTRGGPHIVYGLCHELGHVLMGWEDSRHKWAHYLGSLLVDDVATRIGAKLWPQPYNYGAEGMKRFLADIEDVQPDRGSDEGTARIFYEVGETFGLSIWGKALAWIRENRKGTSFHAVRRYRLDDLREALLKLDGDPAKVRAILG